MSDPNLPPPWPLDVLLAAMRHAFAQAESSGTAEDYRLAATFAEKAAPYVHARLGTGETVAGAGGHEAALAALAAALVEGEAPP